MRSSSVSGLGVAVGEVESLHVKSHSDDDDDDVCVQA